MAYANDFKVLDKADRPTGDVWKASDFAVSRDRNPVEVVATIRSEGDKEPFRLVFELNTKAPFELRNVVERGN
jgi:hypothetical protein